MICKIAPSTFALQCDGCGAPGVGASLDAADARGLGAVLGWRYDGNVDSCPRCLAAPAPAPMFAMGRLVSTRGVSKRLTRPQIAALLERHARGDWGDVGKEDARANTAALEHGSRIMSVYHVPVIDENPTEPAKVYVITEADRTSTCVLFADEY